MAEWPWLSLSTNGRKLPGLLMNLGTIDYGWLGVGRWIVDGRDEDGSWPTTDQTAVKTLPSLMGIRLHRYPSARSHHVCVCCPTKAAARLARSRLAMVVRFAQISIVAVNEAGEDVRSSRPLPSPLASASLGLPHRAITALGEDEFSG
ncbi:hypothetical protein ACLOJK_038239 [Asimina triloba]